MQGAMERFQNSFEANPVWIYYLVSFGSAIKAIPFGSHEANLEKPKKKVDRKRNHFEDFSSFWMEGVVVSFVKDDKE